MVSLKFGATCAGAVMTRKAYAIRENNCNTMFYQYIVEHAGVAIGLDDTKCVPM
jgi:hypothetical protein